MPLPTLDLTSVSLAEIIAAALSQFSSASFNTLQPVAMTPGRNAMDVDTFVKRSGLMPFSGSEGVLLGMTNPNANEWMYLHLRETDAGDLSVEPDEDMTGVKPLTLSGDITAVQLSNAVQDQFIAMGAFSRSALIDA